MNQPDHSGNTLLRAAAYCRVSKNLENQLDSLENQCRHYEDLITGTPGWRFAGIYAESGVSGTSSGRRPELARLMRDCRAGAIDLVLTKSISRFARNTADCLSLVRELRGLGVRILFEKENIDTGTGEGELLLSLFATIAEEESRSISGNTAWSLQKRFREGTFRLSKAPYGYRLKRGSLAVSPREARIVREIFDAALSGEGSPSIAARLNRRGIRTGTLRRDGSPGIWTSSRILGILKNQVYTGDLLMQKTWKDAQFRRHRNLGDVTQYLAVDHHPPIVSRETFRLAQEAVQQRGREKGIPYSDPASASAPDLSAPDPGSAPPLSPGCFSGRLFCRSCGKALVRITRPGRSDTPGERRLFWGCPTHRRNPRRCPQKPVSEASLQNAFLTMLNRLSFGQEALLNTWLAGCRAQILKDTDTRIAALREQLRQNADLQAQLSLRLSHRPGNPSADSAGSHDNPLAGDAGSHDNSSAGDAGSHAASAGNPALDALRRLQKEAALLEEQLESALSGTPEQSTTESETRKLRRLLSARRSEASFRRFSPGHFFSAVESAWLSPDGTILFRLRCGLAFSESVLSPDPPHKEAGDSPLS